MGDKECHPGWLRRAVGLHRIIKTKTEVMKKGLLYVAGLLILTTVSCKKDEAVAPINDMEPIVEAPLIPIGKILDQSVITNAEYIDGQFFCPESEIEIGVTTDLTVEKIVYHGLYISGFTGDTTVMWSREESGHQSIHVSYYDAAEAVIIADVYALEGNDRTPPVKPRGYDFPPPLIEHEEHPVLYAENGYVTTLRNGFPGAAHIKWTKDYMEISGETSEELTVTESGMYDIKISYAECPEFFQNAGGIEVVSAVSVVPSVTVNGSSVLVSNYAQMQYATLELLDASGNTIQYNGFTNSFDNVPSGQYTIRASFWGSEFYMGLGDIGRVSICNSVSSLISI